MKKVHIEPKCVIKIISPAHERNSKKLFVMFCENEFTGDVKEEAIYCTFSFPHSYQASDGVSGGAEYLINSI